MENHSKVTRTGSSGVYSQASSRGSDDTNCTISSNGYTRGSNRLASFTHGHSSNLDKLLGQLPPELRKITWEIKNEVARHLNKLKDPIGNDYHLVASRLGFSDVIEEFENARNPTQEMFKHCNNITTEHFFNVLQDIGRSDVIDDLLSYLTRNSNHYCLPTQESLEDKERLSQPFEESCSNLSKFSKQPSEQDDEEEKKISIPCDKSRDFWNKIPGPFSQKKWKDFFSAMKEACPNESDHGGIDKFLCHIFQIDYDKRCDGEVRVEYFIRLINCFGPFVPGTDGCLEKMYQLSTKSLVSGSSDGKKHSWFAGYMNKQETEDRLKDLDPGHFLIRFSGSRVDDGWFILGVKTRDEVLQIEIEREISSGKHRLADELFSDLPSIVHKLRNELFLEECPQFLINPCPDLPLNINFVGYTKATRRQRGRGRGKPR